MNKSLKISQVLKEKQVVALLTPKSVEQCLTAYEVFSPLGITLEIAFRSDVAMTGIQKVLKAYPDALILAGTVLAKKQAEMAIEAGVAGVVSADYISSVVEVCVKHDIMCVPGGLGMWASSFPRRPNFTVVTSRCLKRSIPINGHTNFFPLELR